MSGQQHAPDALYPPGKDLVPILQEAGRAPGPVWTGGKSRPHRDSIPDRPARSQSLYQLSYQAHQNIPGTHFYYRLSQPQGHSVAESIMSIKYLQVT